MRHTIASHTAGNAIVPFPAEVNLHWETENRAMWNEQERVAEQQQLVYEVSWIPELGAWRRFLRARHKARS